MEKDFLKQILKETKLIKNTIIYSDIYETWRITEVTYKKVEVTDGECYFTFDKSDLK